MYPTFTAKSYRVSSFDMSFFKVEILSGNLAKVLNLVRTVIAGYGRMQNTVIFFVLVKDKF